MKKVKRNLGIGEVGGGSHERPEAKSLVKAEATARDGGLGGAGVAKREKKAIFKHAMHFFSCFICLVKDYRSSRFLHTH